MSKKTEAIYSSLDRLDQLLSALKESNSLGSDGQEPDLKKLDDLSFEMGIQLKELRFWIDSLYSYNGKSTSRAKKSASKENGKKGGRPPKEITLAKRRVLELENQVIPDLESKIRLAVSSEDEDAFSAQLKKAEEELFECKKKIMDFKSALPQASLSQADLFQSALPLENKNGS